MSRVTIICLKPDDAFKYFQTMPCLKPSESIQRLGKMCNSKQEILEIYKNSLLDFTQAEINALQWYVNMLSKIILEKAPHLFTTVWKFIKLKQGIDLNYPYTIGDAIVLPQTVLNEMVQTRCNKNPTNSLLGLEGPSFAVTPSVGPMITNNVYANRTIDHIKIIFHEYVHIYQRRNQETFNKFYMDFWNFTKISPQQLRKTAIYNSKVTNPDSVPNVEWVVSIIRSGTNRTTEWYYPMPMMSSDGKSLIGILVQVNQVWNVCTGRYDYYMTNKYELIQNVREYKNLFYGQPRQLYDPNEAMANTLTDYVIANIEYTNPSFSSNRFYTALRKLIGSVETTPSICLSQIGCNAC